MKGEINEDVTAHEIQTNPYSPVTIVAFEDLPEPTTAKGDESTDSTTAA